MLGHLRFRTKIELGIAALVVGTALLLALAAARTAGEALKDEHRKRGVALAEILAARSVDPLLARDLLRLKNTVDDLKKVDGDILYAFVQDERGHVMVHTFPGGFPVDLLEANALPGEAVSRTQLLAAGNQLVDDFASAVSAAGDRIGTARLGISRVKIMADVGRMTFVLLAIAGALLLVAIGAGTFFARRVTARLGLLKSHAEEVIRGNLDLQTGPTLSRNCWEIMACGQGDCPAYGEVRRRCWHLAGTLCQDCDVGKFPDKLDSCRDCPVWRQNVGDEIQDLAEAFDVMALSLKSRIEDLKDAERNLQHQHQLIRTILDVTPDLVSLLDADLTYRQPNKAFAASVGKGVDEVVGKTDADLFPPEVAERRTAKNREVLSTGRKVEMESSRESGRGSRWYHTVVIPVLDNEGRITGVLRTARDVTELKTTQEQLIQAQKLESLGKLAGGVAHEINTPLGIILGYAQLLQEDAPPGSQILEDLRTIEKQSKVCKKIVADLLGFSRRGAGSRMDLCVNNTVLEGVSLVRHTFELDKVRILTDLDERMPIIHGDPERLKQVWINLLGNSRDAMPGGGAIKVRTRLDVPAHRLRLWVADTGAGIGAEDLGRIFDPFYTTKPVGLGTGLGLAVSFGIVEDHGGTIRAESPAPGWFAPDDLPEGAAPGPGTVFLVELPVDNVPENSQYPRDKEG
ncbi:MAG: ATP-binding protein [Thermodesulfobacteriota bacterium]